MCGEASLATIVASRDGRICVKWDAYEWTRSWAARTRLPHAALPGHKWLRTTHCACSRRRAPHIGAIANNLGADGRNAPADATENTTLLERSGFRWPLERRVPATGPKIVYDRPIATVASTHGLCEKTSDPRHERKCVVHLASIPATRMPKHKSATTSNINATISQRGTRIPAPEGYGCSWSNEFVSRPIGMISYNVVRCGVSPLYFSLPETLGTTHRKTCARTPPFQNLGRYGLGSHISW